jgi:hypothetical protein
MRFADYLTAFNRYDDAALIRDFWAKDCIMETAAGRVMRGQAEVLAMLDRLHDGVRETMRPQTVIEDGRRIFAEIDMDFTGQRDRPDFPFGPLKAGETLTVKVFALYRAEGGKVVHLKTATWPAGVGVTRPG